MPKVENIEQVIADYKKEYRRITGNTCPEVLIKRAWINVGVVSFRPEELVQGLESLRKRPDFKDAATDIQAIEDFQTLTNAKSNLMAIQNNLLSLRTIPSDDMEKVCEYIGKTIDEIDDSINRNVMF